MGLNNLTTITKFIFHEYYCIPVVQIICYNNTILTIHYDETQCSNVIFIHAICSHHVVTV